MPDSKPNSLISLDDTNWLKGLAIIAVLWIHALSALPSAIVWGPQFRTIVIFLDQLSRFCVPLFIFLSGYGLSFSYTRHSLTYLEFVKKRVLKLLPLYLLWSGISMALFWLVPAWHGSSAPFVMQLLLGQADYQMYFVPLIFVLYLLFPLLFRLVKRFGVGMVIVAIGLQLLTFAWFKMGTFNFLKLPYLQIDQFQYLFPLSWIAYFVMGMWASSLKRVPASLKFWQWGWLAAWVWVASSADYNVAHGLDPLLALKFTRSEMVAYATFAIGGLITFVPSRQKVHDLFNTSIAWLGKYSYLIFLAHTWLIRILFGWGQSTVTTMNLLLASLIFVSAIGASTLLLRREKI